MRGNWCQYSYAIHVDYLHSVSFKVCPCRSEHKCHRKLTSIHLLVLVPVDILHKFTKGTSFIWRTFYNNLSKRPDVQILSLPPDQQVAMDKKGML